MDQGTIKHFDERERTGTLLTDDRTEVAIDAGSLEGSEVLTLRIGQRVRFDLVDPAAEAPVTISTERLGLTRGDLAALTRVLVNWLIMIAAVWIATAVVPGIHVNGGLYRG